MRARAGVDETASQGEDGGGTAVLTTTRWTARTSAERTDNESVIRHLDVTTGYARLVLWRRCKLLLTGPPRVLLFPCARRVDGGIPSESLRRAAFLQISPAQLMIMGAELYFFCLYWLLCSLPLTSGVHGITNTEITIFNDADCGTKIGQLNPNTANDCENTLGGSQSFRIEIVDTNCSRMSLAART